MKLLIELQPVLTKKKIHLLFGLLTLTLGYAQQGIGTNRPNPETALPIYAEDKGVLLPKVSLDNANELFQGVTATASDTGMRVYNTNTATHTGLTGVGYYLPMDGGQWEKFTAGGDLFWDLDCNTGVQVEPFPYKDSICFDTVETLRVTKDETRTLVCVQVHL